MTTQLPISQIRRDGDTQPRVSLNALVVEAYIESIQEGVKFPPVDVFFDGEHYWLADGFHRHSAFLGAKFEKIECNVHQGTLEDAQWFSYTANQTHGLFRSNADKHRAIQAALRHPAGAGLSDREIGRHVGVDHKTVAAWRDRIWGNSPDSKPSPTRKATRNGKSYKINVARIGKTKPTQNEETETRNTDSINTANTDDELQSHVNSNTDSINTANTETVKATRATSLVLEKPNPHKTKKRRRATLQDDVHSCLNALRTICREVDKLKNVPIALIPNGCSDGEAAMMAHFARKAAQALEQMADSWEER